jgi:hypothetical protein
MDRRAVETRANPRRFRRNLFLRIRGLGGGWGRPDGGDAEEADGADMGMLTRTWAGLQFVTFWEVAYWWSSG